MINELKQISSTPHDIRKFGLLVGGILVVLAVVSFILGGSVYPYLAIVGFALVVLGVVLPVTLKPAYYVWMALAVALGWIVSRIILVLLFYVVLTPIGLVSRLVGKRYMQLGPDQAATTYWQYREKPEDPKRAEKQY